MVCSRGESLTTHTNQMKLFNAIATAAVIGISATAVRPANASAYMNVITGEWIQKNDGVPVKVMEGPMGKVNIKDSHWAYPLNGSHGSVSHKNITSIDDGSFLQNQRRFYYQQLGY